MADIDLFQALETFNSHWQTGTVSPVIKRTEKRRRAFLPQRERIRKLPFQVLAGPRQVGKTTLVGHLIQDLLDSGIHPSHIVYVPLDIPRIGAESQGSLEPILLAYERFVLKQRLSAAKNLVFLFLDEIHTLSNWSKELKAAYDQYHPILRVLATGSSSAALFNPETADLPGRVETVRMYPMKFTEILEGRHPELFTWPDSPLLSASKAARETLRIFDGSSGSRKKVRAAFERLYTIAAKDLPLIEAAFEHYLIRGGYPASAVAATAAEAFRFHQATIDTMLSKDLKLFPKVRKPGGFQSFMALLARDHGGKFNASSYAQELQVDKESPAHWKAITEDLFLAHQLPPMSESLRPVPRKADKAYIQDPGLRAFLAIKAEIADLEKTGEIGQAVEGVLFDHLRRLQFNVLDHRNGIIGYWNKPEIDFIVQLPKGWLAVEAKYSASPKVKNAGLKELLAARKDVLGIVAGRREFAATDGIVTMPAWMLAVLA